MDAIAHEKIQVTEYTQFGKNIYIQLLLLLPRTSASNEEYSSFSEMICIF